MLDYKKIYDKLTYLLINFMPINRSLTEFGKSLKVDPTLDEKRLVTALELLTPEELVDAIGQNATKKAVIDCLGAVFTDTHPELEEVRCSLKSRVEMGDFEYDPINGYIQRTFSLDEAIAHLKEGNRWIIVDGKEAGDVLGITISLMMNGLYDSNINSVKGKGGQKAIIISQRDNYAYNMR